jgi:hypothetical protein
MGWKEIKPTVLGAKNHTCHVALAASSNGGGRRFAQWFELSFDVTNPDLAWLKLDLKVKVEIGERENAALLRITQNGPFKVCKTGGKSATRLRLRVPALPGQTAEKMKMTALTYRAPAGGGHRHRSAVLGDVGRRKNRRTGAGWRPVQTGCAEPCRFAAGA